MDAVDLPNLARPLQILEPELDNKPPTDTIFSGTGMTSKVESVSAQTVYRPAPEGGKPTGNFPETYRIAAAKAQRNTRGQEGNTAAFSQNIDAAVAGAARGSDTPAAENTSLEKPVRQPFGSHDPSTGTLAELNTPPAVAAQPLTSVPPPSAPLSEIDEMVVDLRYGRMILSPAIMGLGNEARLFLPLVQVSRILDFNISTRRDTGRVGGWFIDEDRTLDFNPATGTGVVDGKPVSLDSSQYMARKDGVYVDAAVLSQWFPIDFSYDFSEQSVLIDPRETLPFQERMAREEMMRDVRRLHTSGPVRPLALPAYQFIDPMFVDFGFSGQHKETEKPVKKNEGQFYLLGRGDLAFMNAELYVTGDEDDHLNNIRLTLMREDPFGQLLGPLQATSVSLGDVRTPSFPIVGGGKFETGVTAGNLPLNATAEYDTTFFAGSLAPGWDAQIFRNGVLLDSQRVGADGRYAFEDVPLYYGTNEFTFKFYGPQGQEQEKTEKVVVGSSMMRPGKAEYQVSYSRKDEKLYDPLNRPNTLDKDTGRFIGRLRYGAGKNLSFQGGLQSQTIDGRRHDYLNAGVQGVAGDTFLSADAIKDLAGGTALELLGQKKAGPVDLKARQQFFNDFIREGETDLSNTMRSRTDLSAFGVFKGKGDLPDMPYSLSVKQTQRKNTTERSASGRIAAGFKKTYVNNSLTWKNDSGLTQDGATVEGAADLTANLGKLRLRGTMNYDLHPDTEITQSRVSGLYSLSRELSSELSVTHDAENDDLVTGSLGLNWNNGKYIVSPRVSYNSDDEMTAFLSFSTSFGMDRRSGKTKFTSVREASQGAISARVFHDKNNNRVFDEGDTPISGARVSADQQFKTAETDEKGIAFLTGLRKHQQTDISLKTDSLEDPFWEESGKGRSVMPRPGHVDIVDIPVITTGEIDGTLYLAEPGKEKERLTHVPVQLLDVKGNVVKELKSEYDGFYLFMKVPPGDYRVRLAPGFEKTLGTKPMNPVPVTIGNDGTVVSGHDLIFTPRTAMETALGRTDTSLKKPSGQQAGAEQTTAAPAPRPEAADTTPILAWENTESGAGGAARDLPQTPPAEKTTKPPAGNQSRPVRETVPKPDSGPEPRRETQAVQPAAPSRSGATVAQVQPTQSETTAPIRPARPGQARSPTPPKPEIRQRNRQQQCRPASNGSVSTWHPTETWMPPCRASATTGPDRRA